MSLVSVSLIAGQKNASESEENSPDPEEKMEAEQESQSSSEPSEDKANATTPEPVENKPTRNENQADKVNAKKQKKQKKENDAKQGKESSEPNIPKIKKEFESLRKFGEKSRVPAIKNNIARASEMGLELVRKCNMLKQKNESFLADEQVFKQLQAEYISSSAVCEDLVQHLETLVHQLSLENSALKETFKANGLEIPIKEEAFPSLQKKQTKKQKKEGKNKSETPAVQTGKGQKKLSSTDLALSEDDSDWAAPTV